MPQASFLPIHPNPYIVGNPIRSREMFFGRVDEFSFIERTLENGQKTALIVLFGERRSGKSSILYQILNGQLGETFLPIFVDMQIMAGIANEAEFFGRIIAETGKMLGKNGSALEPFALRSSEPNPSERFRQFLKILQERFPQRAVLLLIDEYEILEAKISEGCLSRNILIFFAGLLETERVSFVFTGSKRLELRDETLWGGELLQKATSRKISFLTKDDTARLITEPLAKKVTFAPEVIAQIHTLTAGQPFYTQLICQNLVYHLNEVKKYLVESADLQAVVESVLENPPPQMIFNWGEHTAERKLTLSLLAQLSAAPGVFLSAHEIRRGIAKNKLELVVSHAQLNSVFAELFLDEYVLQKDHKYAFRLELFRRWIRRDHNIWQVKQEIGPEELARITKPAEQKATKWKRARTAIERSLLVAAVMAVAYFGFKYFFSSQRKVMIRANGGPFQVEVDGKAMGTTRGQEDSTIFIAKELRKDATYEINATLLASNESKRRQVEITEDNQNIPFDFGEFPVTIISDAFRLKGKLGGLEFPNEDHPESWQYTFGVTAGTYPLSVWNSQNDSSPIDTILAIPTRNDTIRIDFPDLVIITLKANLPIVYKYAWTVLQEKRSQTFENQISDSIFVLRGRPKGSYQFIFTNPITGETIPKNKFITTDDTINVNFGDTVIITLRANVPFDYEYTWNASQKKKGKALNSTLVLNGYPRGSYRFIFTDPRTGKTISRNRSITSNAIISFDFLDPVTHRLQIETEPRGAEVILNGTPSGKKTTYMDNLSEGFYKIELKKEGYEPYSTQFKLTRDTTLSMIELKPQYGSLLVLVKDWQGRSVADAKVYLDNNPLGETPLKVQRLTVGPYTLRVEKLKYVTAIQQVVIQKNETSTIPITLEEKR